MYLFPDSRNGYWHHWSSAEQISDLDLSARMTADILEKGEVEDRQSSFLSEVDKVASFLKHCQAKKCVQGQYKLFWSKDLIQTYKKLSGS